MPRLSNPKAGVRKVYKVLVVDDEDLVVEVLRELLSELPYTVVTTTDPAKAIQILKLWEIAVLVCDLNMPQIDGVEVMVRAREANPDIISIMVSGVADQESIVRAVNEGGVWKFLFKPWNSRQLTELVDEGVKRYMKTRGPSENLERLAHNVTAQLKDDDESGAAKRPAIRVIKRERKTAGLEKTADIGTSRYRLGDELGAGGTGTAYTA